MTTANMEFADLMPHRIEVTGLGDEPEYDDWGDPIETTGTRVYMCLLDDTTTTVRSADGVSINVALTAYIAPVPIGSTDNEPVDIKSEESVKIVVPYEKKMTVKNIERHYDSEDGVGMLHNLTIRFG